MVCGAWRVARGAWRVVKLLVLSSNLLACAHTWLGLSLDLYMRECVCVGVRVYSVSVNACVGSPCASQLPVPLAKCASHLDLAS